MTTNFPVADAAAAATLAAIEAATPALNGDGGALSHVTNFPATQAVSAASLPLPSGAAIAANQTTANTSLSSIATSVAAGATASNQAAGNTSLTAIASSAAASATAANQATGNTSLATIASAQGAGASGVTLPTGGTGMLGWLSGIYSKLSGTLAVSGTFFQATQPVSAAALPLPTGAAADGTDATGVTILTGGVGIRGWLSSIYSAITTATQKFALQPAFTPTGNSTASSITAANTDQVILVANAARRFLMIQNTHATAALIIALNGASTATAGTPNITLQAGQILLLDVAVPVTAIHAQSATLGATYSIVEG